MDICHTSAPILVVKKVYVVVRVVMTLVDVATVADLFMLRVFTIHLDAVFGEDLRDVRSCSDVLV